MEDKPSGAVRSKSPINYDYATVRITQSRIDKGLIAIPVSLAEQFPARSRLIQVYLNDSPVPQTKQYSSYTSSTNESRIYGMTEWFGQNNIKDGDEVVIQLLDKKNFIYRLAIEQNFVAKTQELERNFDISQNEDDASNKLKTLSEWTHQNEDKVSFSEFVRLSNAPLTKERPYVKRTENQARERVPAHTRTLLRSIYQGHCQVCDFWFLKRNKQPYFETHHLIPSNGHHLKNVMVVCSNCHSQFEYADVKPVYNDGLWLIKVSFNKAIHPVKQAMLDVKMEGFFKELFV